MVGVWYWQPGLTGGSQDTYVRHMLLRARSKGRRVVVFNSRGCASSPVTTAKVLQLFYCFMRQTFANKRKIILEKYICINIANLSALMSHLGISHKPMKHKKHVSVSHQSKQPNVLLFLSLVAAILSLHAVRLCPPPFFSHEAKTRNS
jgi:hypothetical protein